MVCRLAQSRSSFVGGGGIHLGTSGFPREDGGSNAVAGMVGSASGESQDEVRFDLSFADDNIPAAIRLHANASTPRPPPHYENPRTKVIQRVLLSWEPLGSPEAL